MTKIFIKILICIFAFTASCHTLSAQSTPVKISEQIEERAGRYVYIHLVEQGQTLYSIAKAYNVSVKDIIAPDKNAVREGDILIIPCKNPPAKITNPEPVVKPEAVTPKPSYILYEVKPKDNVYRLCKTYEVEESAFLALNPKVAEFGLKAGDTVKIPSLKHDSFPVSETKTDTIVQREANRIKITPDKPCIALMLPLYLDNTNEINLSTSDINKKKAADYKSLAFIQFYEGFKLACDNLAKNYDAKVYVYDVTDNEKELAQILNKPEMKKMDLIVGPFFYNTFAQTAEFAKANEIPIVNPVTTKDVVKDNPFVFKLIPNSSLQAQSIAEFINSKYPKANVILSYNSKDNIPDDIEVYKSCLKTANITAVDHGVAGLQGIFNAQKPDQINILITNIESEIFVNSLVSRLGKAATPKGNTKPKEIKNITFAPKAWKNYDQLEIEYLQNIGLHLYEPAFVDYTQSDVKDFVNQFENTYKTSPNEYGFNGRDVATYFITALKTLGSGFYENINTVNVPMLQTQYKFIHTKGNGFENSYIDIYKFEDYKLLDARGEK